MIHYSLYVLLLNSVLNIYKKMIIFILPLNIDNIIG